mgnify:CR=1 FL=1
MGRQLKKPWNDFKTDAYSIPGVSEVRHRDEEHKKKNIDMKWVAVAAIVFIALILLLLLA